jgi:hypothetical protein
MQGEHPASEEVVIKEYPNSTRWLDGGQVRAAGNLILTDERLVFVRQVPLSQKEIETLQQVSSEGTTSDLIRFALKLHKKNFQLPLSSIVSVKLGLCSIFPVPQPCMRISYKTAGKNVKTLSFWFRLPLFKRLLMSEFPTLDWIRAIKKAVKAQRRAGEQARISRTV